MSTEKGPPVIVVPHTTKRFRMYQAAAYLLIGLAGVVLMIDPTRSIQEQEILIRVVLSSFLIIGACFTIYGAGRDRWIPELIGLPFLWSALAVFVIILVSGGNTGALAVACLFGAIVVILSRRFHDLANLATSTRRIQREMR